MDPVAGTGYGSDTESNMTLKVTRVGFSLNISPSNYRRLQPSALCYVAPGELLSIGPFHHFYKKNFGV